MIHPKLEFLEEKLINQYGKEVTNKIIEGYSSKRKVTLRVNNLKSNVEKIEDILKENNVQYKKVEWNQSALIIENVNENDLRNLKIYDNGEIYLQSLSSMIPVTILNPKESENILDMCAAPGGKTTQIAALSENKALITACEKNKIRAERLKFNIERQGASKVNVMLEDARKLNNYFSFDKILLDAPCSGSGTIDLKDEKIYDQFSEDLINRSKKFQYELLEKAISVLKKGGELVYSTCSILQEENEENVQKILRNRNIKLVPIDKELFKNVPLLKTSIDGTIGICPTDLYEGFFVAKFKKEL